MAYLQCVLKSVWDFTLLEASTCKQDIVTQDTQWYNHICPPLLVRKHLSQQIVSLQPTSVLLCFQPLREKAMTEEQNENQRRRMEEPILNSEFFAAHISFFTFLFKFSSDPNIESTGGFYYTSIDGLGSGPKLGRLLWICVFLFFWERE